MTLEILIEILEAGGISQPQRCAEELINRFHTFSGVLCAEPYQLERLVGERAAMLLKLTAAISSRRVTDGFAFGKRYTEARIKELLVALFRGLSLETLYMLSFDGADRLIGCEFVSEGTVNAASVLPRQLLDRAVKNRAASIAIAHNHPNGISVPSSDDLDFTKSVKMMLSNADIAFKAHYTVAGSECTAMI